jgi:hypothetical protein
MKTYFVRYIYSYSVHNLEEESSMIVDVENPNAKNILNAIRKNTPNLVKILNITPLN